MTLQQNHKHYIMRLFYDILSDVLTMIGIAGIIISGVFFFSTYLFSDGNICTHCIWNAGIGTIVLIIGRILHK